MRVGIVLNASMSSRVSIGRVRFVAHLFLPLNSAESSRAPSELNPVAMSRQRCTLLQSTTQKKFDFVLSSLTDRRLSSIFSLSFAVGVFSV
jgi:hypothetical protein